MTMPNQHYLQLDVEISAVAKLPTERGLFFVKAYKVGHKEHLAIFTEQLCDVPLVRVHSECLTGDALGSRKCDCGEQLDQAMAQIQKSGCGVILYLRQEGRGIGLLNKINAYSWQDKGLDTVEANHQIGFGDDLRTYEIAEFMLHDLGIKKLRLLTNNPKKIESLEDVEIVERIPLVVAPNEHNEAYLKTKKEKSGHLL